MKTTENDINELFHKHFKLVPFTLQKHFKNIIKQIENNTGFTYDDLIQIGSIGLLKACQRYNPKMSTSFSTYAISLIKGEILHTVFYNDKVKMPRKMKRIINKIRLENNDVIDTKEIAEKYNIDCELADVSLYAIETYVSLEEPIKEDKKKCYKDLIEDENNKEIFNEIENKFIIEDFYNTLSKTEKLIWNLYKDGKTQVEIGQLLNKSQALVSKYIMKILKKAEDYGKICGLRAS